MLQILNKVAAIFSTTLLPDTPSRAVSKTNHLLLVDFRAPCPWGRVATVIFLGLVLFAKLGLGQSQKLVTDHVATTTPGSASSLGDGPIASGDTVDVQVFDMPELAVRTRVSSIGDIAMPLLNAFHIAGLTSTEASSAIAVILKERSFVRDPRVLVTVQQLRSSFTVVGEVRNPGIYPTYGKRHLLDILSMAGGLTERAGHLIQVSAQDPETPKQNVLWDPTLVDNRSPDLLLTPGDTITVSRCGVVYVGGNVARPGAYPICDSAHTTIGQTIALAQGILPSTSFKNTILIRTSGGSRKVQQVPIDKILKGQWADIAIQADDIVYVAPSSLKTAVRRTVDVAIAFASTASIYGLR